VKARNGLPVEGQMFSGGNRLDPNAVAVVDGNGDVTGRDVGEEVIRILAFVGGNHENGLVPVLVRGVQLTPSSVRLNAGEQRQTAWKVVTDFGANSQRVTLRSSDTTVVSVSADGLISRAAPASPR
jgi:hypothetical protein